MGIVIKQSIRTTAISYIGVLIGAFNILWLYPKFLEPEKIGVLRLLQDIPFLFAIFAQIGASSINDRFHHYFKNDEKKTFLTVLLLYPLIGFLIFIASFFLFHSYWESLFAEKSTLFIHYLIYLLPLTFFMMYTSIMESYLRSNMHVGWSNFARDILIRIFYTCFVSVYALKLISFDWLIFLIMAGYFISMATLFIHTRRTGNFRLTGKLTLSDKSILKEIRHYLFYLIPGTAGSLLAQKIDTLMLGTMSGEHQNDGLDNVAIYSLAYFIGSVVEVPRKSLTQITIPLLSKAFAEKNMEQVNRLYKKNSLVQFVVGNFIFLLIWINIDDFYLFIPNSELYTEGKYVILFIGISKLFDMATSINGEIIQFSNYYRFNMIAILLLSFLTVTFNFLFIPQYEVTGAAVALCITILLYNLFKTFFIQQKLKLQPFSKEMLPLILICFGTLAYSMLLKTPEHSIPQAFLWIVIRISIFTILFYFLIRKLRISEDINLFIDQLIDKISYKYSIPWLKKIL